MMYPIRVSDGYVCVETRLIKEVLYKVEGTTGKLTIKYTDGTDRGFNNTDEAHIRKTFNDLVNAINKTDQEQGDGSRCL